MHQHLKQALPSLADAEKVSRTAIRMPRGASLFLEQHLSDLTTRKFAIHHAFLYLVYVLLACITHPL